MKKTTKEKALDEGFSLLQQHGYHGFSFQNIADKLNIKKPSLYDHFASKEDLVIAIIHDYSFKFDLWAQSVSHLSPIEKVRKVFNVFHSFVSDKSKVCPILALSVDLKGITPLIQKEMRLFVDKWLTWLEVQLIDGQASGEIRKDMEPRMMAAFIYSQGMGSQFQARIRKEPSLTLSSGDQIVTLIKNPEAFI